VSPVRGDFTGLPPLLFQVGSTEILLDDSRRCADRRRAPVDVESKSGPDAHGWQAFAFVPESRGRSSALPISSAYAVPDDQGGRSPIGSAMTRGKRRAPHPIGRRRRCLHTLLRVDHAV